MSKLLFSELEPGQIDGLWPRYIQGLQEFSRRWPEHADWKMEDFKRSIRTDTARIVNCYDTGSMIGFIVYRRFKEEFSNKKYIHVWMAYIYPEHRGKISQYLPDAFEFLNKVGLKTGAKYIEFDSPRKGWGRLINRLNINTRRIVYRKEVMQ
jgi:hypothetical protein